MDADRRICWGFSLFCDDLRAEVGGKVSAMGLYQNELLFSGSFPYVIPKFTILVMYYELVGELTTDISLRVYLPSDEPDKASIQLDLLRKDLPKRDDQAPLPSEVDGERINHLRVPIILAPAVITKEGFFKVRAHFSDGKILRLGRMKVRALSPEEAAKIPGMGQPQVKSESE
jgi:hypothetical protein